MSMVLFVMHDPSKLEEVLSAWEEAGVTGATAIHSTGMGRLLKTKALQEDIPLLPALEDFYQHAEEENCTVFSVLKDDTLVPQILAATERVVGRLSEPFTGLLVVIPTSQVFGLEKRR